MVDLWTELFQGLNRVGMSLQAELLLYLVKPSLVHLFKVVA